MSAHHKLIEQWSVAPDSDVRKRKTAVEDEMLIKLGVKKEVIEFHPLILSSRLQRAKTSISLNYSRVSPPARELSSFLKNSWSVQDPALRQLSNAARRGPRDCILPNLVKSPAHLKVEPVPSTDVEYHARRATAFERLTQLLNGWTVYQRRAFPTPPREISLLSDIDPNRKISKGSLIHLAQGSPRRRSTAYTACSDKEKKKSNRPVPKSRKQRNLWKDMARQALLHVKATQMKLPEELPRSELRIYVSSTPDLQEEREFLEEVAYPKLRDICEKLGLNCHVVDMRNGAGILTNDIETFDLIETELRRCRRLSVGPFFISLIGHDIDDQKLPGFLHKSVYEEIRETLVKENIYGVEAFDDVYRLDSNRVTPVYIKQPIQAMNEYQGPEEVERILLEALSQAVSLIRKNKASEELMAFDFYKWSAVVKEVEEGLLTSYSPRSDTLCFMMDSDLDKDTPNKDTPINRLRHNVCKHYKHFACMDNLYDFKSGKKTIPHLRSLCDTFVAGVASLIKSNIRHREYDITQQLTEGSEALQHVRIAYSEAGNNTSNQHIMEKIKEIVERTDTSPKTVLLYGQSGSGKTAIASQVAKASTFWQPRRKVVFRCLCSTLRSSSLFRLLESLIRQLNFIYSMEIDLPLDISLQEAVSVFCYALNTVSAKRHLHGNLLMVLDQLDKLPDLDSHFLLCILNSVSEGTTLFLTLQSPHPLMKVLMSHPSVDSMTRLTMNNAEISRHVLESLDAVGRSVTDDQLIAGLTALPAEPPPLYSQLVFHIIRWWPSHTLQELKRFSNSPESDFEAFLDFLEMALGKAFIRYTLSLLATAKFGLADQEILYILSKDSELLDEIKKEADKSVSVVEGFSYQLQFSRLIARLNQFVIDVQLEGETVYQISCRPLVKAITCRYMSDEFFYSIHNRLANFFLFYRRGLLLSSRDISEGKHKELSKYHWRTMRCVPYHLCHSTVDSEDIWERLKEKVFFNFSWLVNEVYSGCFNDLVADISYALEHVSLDPDVQYLQQRLLSVRRTVIHNPLSLAAVFSSQNIDNLLNVQDNVRTIVQEARAWLKQVQLQALVPVSYTPDKRARLLVKDNSIFDVTDLQPINGTGQLLLQRQRVLSILNILTGEEVPLAALKSDIVCLHMSDGDKVIVLSLTKSLKPKLEIFDLQKGKHLKSIPLGDTPLLWFHVSSTSTAYFANQQNIKRVDLVKGKIANVITMKTSWFATCMAASTSERVIAVQTGDKTKVEWFPAKDVAQSKFTNLTNQPPNKYCKPLISTKDGKYIIYVSERQAEVIECAMYKDTDTFSHKGLPIVLAHLSRSHEHLFLAYANGSITCHVFRTGNEALETKIKPKPKPEWTYGARSRSQKLQNEPKDEMFTSILTSEDDHFLLCATNLGHVYILHVPTGLQLVDITTEQKSLSKMTFLTDSGHFQHLITTDVEGSCRHWNLRPLFKQARLILQPYMCDDDLIQEEDTKLELKQYYAKFEARKNDRIFLNGPDIAAFYKKPPENIFQDLAELDPSFGVQNDWQVTGKIADLCDHLQALICGNDLSDFILTISSDFRLAKWSLHDGRLEWSRKLPCDGNGIQDIALVYYDQAVLLVERSRVGLGCCVTVIYTGEGVHKIMSRDNVICYWASLDRTQIMLMCRGTGPDSDNKLYSWDLIAAKEETRSFLHPLPTAEARNDDLTFTTFSPSLEQNIFVVLPQDEAVKGSSQNSHRLSAKRRQMSLHSAPEPDIDYSRTESADHFEIADREDELEPRPSISHRSLHRPDSRLMTPDGQDLSKASSIIASPHLVSPRPESVDSVTPREREILDTTIGEETQEEALSEQLLSETVTTIHWTKVSKSDFTPASKLSRRRKSGLGHLDSKRRASVTGKASNISVIEEIGESEGDEVEKREQDYSQCSLKVQLTAICFVGEEDILVGTHTKHLLLINLPLFHAICALGVNGPRITDVLSEEFLKAVTTPHKNVINYVTTTDDTSMLVSADSGVVCLWNAITRTLAMTIKLDRGQEISNMVISKDAAIIAIATNNRTVRLWTPLEQREVANYMATFDITDLQMTCDCRKVVVRGVGPENKPMLEIFDVKNIDDVLIRMLSRKESQQQERSQNLTKERKISRQQSEGRRKSLAA